MFYLVDIMNSFNCCRNLCNYGRVFFFLKGVNRIFYQELSTKATMIYYTQYMQIYTQYFWYLT